MKNCVFLFVMLIILGKAYGQNASPVKEIMLEKAIETGLKNNPELKAAAEKINAAKARFSSGISLPSPEVSLSYELIPSGKGFSEFEERTIEIKQSFDFPTKYFTKASILNSEEELELYRYKSAELKLISEIKTAYYNVLAKKGNIKLAAENIEIMENFFSRAELRFKAGECSELERLTAKVQLNEARNNYEVLKNQLKSLFSELNKVIGCGNDYINEEALLTDSLSFTNYQISFNQIYNEAVNKNPQLKINSLAVDISKYNKTMAWSSLLPDISISYMKQANSISSSYYGASFGITVPLWFMFKQKGEIQEASANSIIAENELTAEKNSMYTRIKNCFNEYENYKKQIELYMNEILPESNEIHRVAIKSYEVGEISYVEYLQSKQVLINSKNNFINLLLSYNNTLTELEQVSGCKITN